MQRNVDLWDSLSQDKESIEAIEPLQVVAGGGGLVNTSILGGCALSWVSGYTAVQTALGV